MYKKIVLASLLTLAAAPALAAEKYAIDVAHTTVVATWNHFGFSNQSVDFHDFDGTFDFDAADPTKSSIDITIPLATLHTGVTKLDEHIKSPDFFDAAKFPKVTFKSTKIEKSGSDSLKVTGDLNLHGVTKPVTLDVKINKIADHPMKKVPAAGFDAHTTIKRSEFGIEKYVPNVSDDIKISISMEAQKGAAK
jgi:polyisoprenoid-binding protein YceI